MPESFRSSEKLRLFFAGKNYPDILYFSFSDVYSHSGGFYKFRKQKYNVRRKKGEDNMKELLSQEEINLKRLAKSPILMNFVKKNAGRWDHAKWLAFLEYLKGKGYFPIDTDQVGLLLESKKIKYFENKNPGI